MRRRNPEVSTPVIVVASLAAGAALAWWYSNRSTGPSVVQAYTAPLTVEQQAAQQALLARVQAPPMSAFEARMQGRAQMVADLQRRINDTSLSPAERAAAQQQLDAVQYVIA
jgi:hypothetical protein